MQKSRNMLNVVYWDILDDQSLRPSYTVKCFIKFELL